MLARPIFHHLVADFGAPDGMWLQEHLAPCRASKRSKAAKENLSFKVRPWVCQGPDLNPIENARGELDSRLRGRKVALKNKDELWAALCGVLDSMPEGSFHGSVTSMPRHVAPVLATMGSEINY